MAPRNGNEFIEGLRRAPREVWVAARLGPEASLAYNESVSLHLRGDGGIRAVGGARAHDRGSPVNGGTAQHVPGLWHGLWHSLVAGPNADRLRFALRRWGSALQRKWPEDELIDLWILGQDGETAGRDVQDRTGFQMPAHPEAVPGRNRLHAGTRAGQDDVGIG